MKTTLARSETHKAAWVHLSARDQVLGRLASRVARILMGKHRPIYTPHVDTGDYVVVTDAASVRVTGNKAETKVYRHHTGWVGNLKERRFQDLLASRPTEVIELAVRRMLPKTKLGRAMFAKLKVYAGPEHPHAAQKPVTITL
jgi:large subunit ribosomal protein L13